MSTATFDAAFTKFWSELNNLRLASGFKYEEAYKKEFTKQALKFLSKSIDWKYISEDEMAACISTMTSP